MATCLTLMLVVVTQIPFSRGLIVERGDNITILCPFNVKEAELTWQINSWSSENISSCSTTSRTCVDYRPDQYLAFFLNDSVLALNITGVQTFESDFTCLTSDGHYTTNISLEVYVWPKNTNCYTTLWDSYAEISCNTTDVYPSLVAQIFRYPESLAPNDFEKDRTRCQILRGCVWVIPFRKLYPASVFTVLMSAYVSNSSEVSPSPVVIGNFSLQLRLPEADIANDTGTCPLMATDNNNSYTGHILVGSSAICFCNLTVLGQPGGRARWLTPDGGVVGEEYQNYSRLVVPYRLSGAAPEYECRAVSGLKVNSPGVKYKPVFKPFAIPEILSSNCPSSYNNSTGYYRGYVLTGSSVSCQCQLSSSSDPPGQARWLDGQGSVLGEENKETRSSTLNISSSNAVMGKVFECRAVTAWGDWDHSLLYRPELADLPQPIIEADGCPGTLEPSSGQYVVQLGQHQTVQCLCSLKSPGHPPGLARWFRKNGDVVGEEDETARTSRLTVVYDMLVLKQVYECRAISLLGSSNQSVFYRPEFSASQATQIFSKIIGISVLLQLSIPYLLWNSS